MWLSLLQVTVDNVWDVFFPDTVYNEDKTKLFITRLFLCVKSPFSKWPFSHRHERYFNVTSADI